MEDVRKLVGRNVRPTVDQRLNPNWMRAFLSFNSVCATRPEARMQDLSSTAAHRTTQMNGLTLGQADALARTGRQTTDEIDFDPE
jgi:hypothetical protein